MHFERMRKTEINVKTAATLAKARTNYFPYTTDLTCLAGTVFRLPHCKQKLAAPTVCHCLGAFGRRLTITAELELLCLHSHDLVTAE
jgi:hypothetical protein